MTALVNPTADRQHPARENVGETVGTGHRDTTAAMPWRGIIPASHAGPGGNRGDDRLPPRGVELRALPPDESNHLWWWLVGRLRRRGHSRENAEDLAAAVFERWLTLGPVASPKGWLWTQAKLRGNNLRKKEARRAKILGPRIEIEQTVVPTAAPDESTDEKALAALADAVGRLPLDLRNVVTLWLRNQSYAEIGRAYEVSPTTVARRLSLAQRRLRAELIAREGVEV